MLLGVTTSSSCRIRQNESATQNRMCWNKKAAHLRATCSATDATMRTQTFYNSMSGRCFRNGGGIYRGLKRIIIADNQCMHYLQFCLKRNLFSHIFNFSLTFIWPWPSSLFLKRNYWNWKSLRKKWHVHFSLYMTVTFILDDWLTLLFSIYITQI